MKIKMELLSDTIFGNRVSVPGGEDISVLRDEYGFPYYRGSTFKGVFRDECIKYMEWCKSSPSEIKDRIRLLFGVGGDDEINNNHKLVFSDFYMSGRVRKVVVDEITDSLQGQGNLSCISQEILSLVTNLRTFTAIENGTVKEGSLRIARCVNRGLVFYSDIKCDEQDEPFVEEILGMVKWVGAMKSRGFGKVFVSRIREDQ